MLDSDGQTVISVEQLNTFLSGKHVIKDFSLSLKKGQCIGVVGATGSGKSVAVKSILKLIDEKEGEITFDELAYVDNKDIDDLRATDVSIVFQNARMSLNPVKKVGRQITRIIQKHKKLSKESAKERVLDLFQKVHIKDIERIFNSFPHEVSGGELQRVMIAMSLSCNPQVIVLDEPAASLDKIIQYKIVELLQELRERETLSLIIISHDLEMIAQLADHVIHINEGEVIASQGVEDFFTKPESKHTQKMVEQLKNFRNLPFKVKVNGHEILNAKDLSFKFPNGNYAFKHISLFLKKGEILGIVGESGSGKSSLGKCLGSIWNPSEGKISVTGKVCYIFQDAYSAMDPDLKVGKILDEVIRNKDGTRYSAQELLEQVLLDVDVIDKRISQLSGGQRQRVNLARALASDPDVLICDEITSGLDLNIQFEIVELLVNKLERITKIFITHDISLAKIACHRLIIMKDGSLVNQGFTKDIFSSSDQEYSTKLINSIPKVKYFLNI